MKLNRQQITELFGSAPEDQDGKKLVGVEYRGVKRGEVYISGARGDWLTSITGSPVYHKSVAIFEATHRADGTPMYIDPLPVVEGYRVEDFGIGMVGKDMGNASGYAFFNRRWVILKDDTMPTGNETLHYARLFKIAQPAIQFDGVTHYIKHPPTTLADLVGEDGQTICYIHAEDGSFSQIKIASNPCDDLIIEGSDDKWYTMSALLKARWSHSPFTTYEDANEFITE